MTGVLVIGEALVDVVHRADGSIDEAPGGSPANVALTLGRLGRHPTLLTSIGDDDAGGVVRRWLDAAGVTVCACRSERTSVAVAHLDAEGSARYEFAIDWSIDADGAPPADVVHLGSIAALIEPGATVSAEVFARHRGRALLSYDPNIRPALIEDREAARRRVLSLVALADVVKASDEDVAWLHPGENVEEVARRWARSGPALVVVTAGAGGAFAVAPDGEVRVAAVETDVVDTVGAGDTFMGALLDGLLAAGVEGADARHVLSAMGADDLAALLRRSATAAAITVGRPGADPPTLAELDAQR